MSALGLGLGLGLPAALAASPVVASSWAPGWVLRDAAGRPALIDLDYTAGRFWSGRAVFGDEAGLFAALGGARAGPRSAFLPLRAIPDEIGLFLDATAPAALPGATPAALLALDGGDWSTRLDLVWRPDGAVIWQAVEAASSYEESVAAGPLGAGDRTRIAAAARAGRHAIARDGAAAEVLGGPERRMPEGLTHLRLGNSVSGYADFAGTIHRLALFAAAPTDADLRRLATPDDAIVVWGDSLAASAFATGFGALFSPPRLVENEGIGGQTSTQVAARQGAMPVFVSLEGDAIPAGDTATTTDRFDAGMAGWSGRTQAGTATDATLAGGALVVHDAAYLQGVQRPLGAMAAGETVFVELDVVLSDLPAVEIGLTWDADAAWAPAARTTLAASGRQSVTLTLGEAGSSVHLAALNPSATVGGFSIAAVAITRAVATPPPVAVTARTVSPVTYQGPQAQTGWLCGVYGALVRGGTGDDHANDTAAYSFIRERAGTPAACLPMSRFEPDAAVAFRGRVALLWAGRNNPAAPERVRADIAAMAARVPGGRYLVGSVLTGTGDDADLKATIGALNAALAAAHGSRFVDILGALLAAPDGSAEDLADLAAGVPPRSLRSDGIHLNAAGNAIARAAWQARLVALGY
ncbi:hypothetical protein [Prosthecomicrobium pneumaticum]|uniref:SGNH hydrolase-type esterase domain-containing protein n=1 Tax=Prosthecomicrobium pneumaticum TaxID=81895 RepID=A0A7W9FR79_9HYPH|nr:hypothetical protein [Prosthecomicrobium pneumaticum]MBB5755276.1 hypothetical protein [Prosthecomicrobium pneumaticum]